MWYRFTDDESPGICRVSNIQLCWYDMTMGGRCFDESFFKSEEAEKVLPYAETVEDIGSEERARIFVNFDNGDVYELKLHKMSPEQIKAACYFKGG